MNSLIKQARKAIRLWSYQKEAGVLGRDQPHACFCVGPQNGEPYCPCRMRAHNRERQQMRQEILAEIKAKRKRKS